MLNVFATPCHSAVLNLHAFSKPIRLCLFATSNKTYLFATTNTFLQHLVYFSENNELDQKSLWLDTPVKNVLKLNYHK